MIVVVAVRVILGETEDTVVKMVENPSGIDVDLSWLSTGSMIMLRSITMLNMIAARTRISILFAARIVEVSKNPLR